MLLMMKGKEDHVPRRHKQHGREDSEEVMNATGLDLATNY